MMTEQTTKITLGLLLCLNIAGISLYGYMLYKISLERTHTTEAIASLTDEIKKEEALRSLSDTLKETALERGKIDGYFVDIKGSAKFLEKLQSFAEGSGASIKLDSVDVDGKTALRVDFSASGSFGDIYRLMELLEATPYVIEVRSMNLSKTEIMTGEKGKKKQAGNRLWNSSFSIRLLSFVNK